MRSWRPLVEEELSNNRRQGGGPARSHRGDVLSPSETKKVFAKNPSPKPYIRESNTVRIVTVPARPGVEEGSVAVFHTTKTASSFVHFALSRCGLQNEGQAVILPRQELDDLFVKGARYKLR